MSAQHEKTTANTLFSIGTVVWAHLDGYPPWPAQIIGENDCRFPSLKVKEVPPHQVLVEFFNDNRRFSLIDKEKTRPLSDSENLQKAKAYRGKYRNQLNNAVKEAQQFQTSQTVDETGFVYVRKESPSMRPSSSHDAGLIETVWVPRQPKRRNSTASVTDHLNESTDTGPPKSTKRMEKRRSSDTLPIARAIARKKRGRKPEARSTSKDILTATKPVPNAIKTKKKQQKLSHSSSENPDDAKNLERAHVSRSASRDSDESAHGLTKTQEPRFGRSKRRRLDPNPDTELNLVLNDIAIPRRKPDGAQSDILNKRDHDKRTAVVLSENVDGASGLNLQNRTQKSAIGVSIDKKVKVEDFSEESLQSDELKERRSVTPKKELRLRENGPKSHSLSSSPAEELRNSPPLGEKGHDAEFVSNHNCTAVDEVHSFLSNDEAIVPKRSKVQSSQEADQEGVRQDTRSPRVSVGTWNLERIADFVPDNSLAQPFDALSKSQLITLITQRETELRRCRLQLWKADSKLNRSELRSATEVESALKQLEELSNNLVVWVHSRRDAGQGRNNTSSPQLPHNFKMFLDCLSEEEKSKFQDMEDNLCNAVLEIRRLRFDPADINLSDNANRLLRVLQTTAKASRRASYALKDITTLWVDIFIFSEIEKKQDTTEANIKDGRRSSSNDSKAAPVDSGPICMDANALLTRARNRQFRPEGDYNRESEREHSTGSGRQHKSSAKLDKQTTSRNENTIQDDGERDATRGEEHGKWSPSDKHEFVDDNNEITAAKSVSLEPCAQSDEGEMDQEQKVNGTKESPKLEGLSPQRDETARLNGVGEKMIVSNDFEKNHTPNDSGIRRPKSGDDAGEETEQYTRTSSEKRGEELLSNESFHNESGLVITETRNEPTGSTSCKNPSGDGNCSELPLSRERLDALSKAKGQAKVIRRGIEKTLVGGRLGKDWQLIFDTIELVVYRRCGGESGEKYRQCMTSVMRAFQQLAQRAVAYDKNPKALKNDDVAQALKQSFEVAPEHSSAAVEHLVSICLEQRPSLES